jgi:hypothetical protein
MQKNPRQGIAEQTASILSHLAFSRLLYHTLPLPNHPHECDLDLLFSSPSNPPPSNSIRRPNLTTPLPNPSISKTLIRSNLTRPHRRLVNRRRRIPGIISRRRRSVRTTLHANRVGVLLPVAVVRVLVVHWVVAVRVVGVVVVVAGVVRVVMVVVVVVWVVAFYHPAVVGEGREVSAQAGAGV